MSSRPPEPSSEIEDDIRRILEGEIRQRSPGPEILAKQARLLRRLQENAIAEIREYDMRGRPKA